MARTTCTYVPRYPIPRGFGKSINAATANKKVGQMRKAGKISDKAMTKHAAGLDSAQDVDAATA